MAIWKKEPEEPAHEYPPVPHDFGPEANLRKRSLESWQMYSAKDDASAAKLRELFPDQTMWAYGQLIIDIDSVKTVEWLLERRGLVAEKTPWNRDVHALAQLDEHSDLARDLQRYLRRSEG